MLLLCFCLDCSNVIVIIVIVAVAILALGLGLGLGLKKDSKKKSNVSPSSAPPVNYFQNGAVATDAKQCSQIGRDILQKGGHAVDAAIASLLCTGVVNLHSTGVAGGGFMILYDKTLKKSIVFDYRETAPSNINETTYDQNPDLKKIGGLAVGIPGEMRGLKMAHEKYGKLPWKDLFQGAIELAKNGTRIGKHMAHYLKGSTLAAIKNDPGLKEILLFANGTVKKEGDIILNPKYARTLEILANDPEDMYSGTIAASILKDIRDKGGNMTSADLMGYKVLVKESISVDSLKGLKLHTTPLPGGGSVLVHILNIVQGFNFTADDLKSLNERVLTYHRIVESFKFSYAMRPHLGDPSTVPMANETTFNETRDGILNKTSAKKHRLKINDASTQANSYYDPFFSTTEDQGTTHVSVIDKDGNAVSATDTINYAFGAKFRSNDTGIIYNNELADFFISDTYGSKLPTPLFNAPKAGRRPLSSTCPSVLTDAEGNVKMVVGASGGTRITLSTAWVIMKKLLFGYTLSSAVEDPRPYHTFSPNYIRNEKGYELADDIVTGLRAKNHTIKNSSYNAIVQAIYMDGDKIFAKSDPRKEGEVAGY